MKVLMISMDPNLPDASSEVSQRIALYRAAVDKLLVVVLKSYGKSMPGKILSFFRAWNEGRAFLKRERFDLITTQDPFAAGLIGYLLKLEFGMRLQLQIHTGLFTPYFWSESEKNRMYVRLARFLLPRASCIKVVSHGIRDYLVKNLNINSSKISVLPVYVSLDKYLYGRARTNLKEKYPQFDFVILMASRLVDQKNIGLAVEAVGELVRKYPQIGLLIVGSGPEEESLKFKVKSLKLEHSVRFEPWTNDLISYYKTADLFLLTSTYEGWARTVVEAMAGGLAIVMTNVGVAGEIVKNGENGVVVPVEDRAAIVRTIEDLYENSQKRKKLASTGRRTIMDLPWRDREKYLELYKKTFEPCQK